VSSLDGHSQPWIHTDTYEECSRVCIESPRLSPATAEKVSAGLTAEPAFARGLGAFTALQMGLVLSDFVREGHLSAVVPESARGALEKRLAELKAQGALTPVETTKDACHVYVAFKRRFGLQRAACLADH
jgi:hypothetical protein